MTPVVFPDDMGSGKLPVPLSVVHGLNVEIFCGCNLTLANCDIGFHCDGFTCGMSVVVAGARHLQTQYQGVVNRKPGIRSDSR